MAFEARTDADGAGKGQQRIHANADHLGHREAEGAEEQDHRQHAEHQPARIARQHIGHRTAGDGPDHLGMVSEGSRRRAVSPERMKAVMTARPPTDRAAHHCTAVWSAEVLECATSSITPALPAISVSASKGHAHQRAPPGSVEDHILGEALPADGWAQGGGSGQEGGARGARAGWLRNPWDPGVTGWSAILR